MGIIATVGRRSFGVTTLIAAMYLLLTLGGISMVYPFLLMLATATTTESDMQEYRLVPAYFTNDNALYRKFLWLRYDTGFTGAAARDYKKAYPGSDISRFRKDEYFGWGDESAKGVAIPPHIDPNDAGVKQRAADLDEFLRRSAVLWPGPPLMETVTAADGTKQRQLVKDPFGEPLDPKGLTTGLGNRYRTVGYIGSVFTGLSGPGRDEWSRFLREFHQATDGRETAALKQMAERHGRPYLRWVQARPGYDMPDAPSWAIVEGERNQTDWLYYKARWLHKHSARALRPTQIAPMFAWDLKAKFGDVDRFNLAMGLAKVDWSASTPAKRAIKPTGRGVVVVREEPPYGGTTNGSAYLLPPTVSEDWSKLTAPFGLTAERIARLNERVDATWVDTLRRRGAKVVHLEPFAKLEDVYVSSRRPIYEPLAAEWDEFVASKVPGPMIQPIDRDPTSQPGDPGVEPANDGPRSGERGGQKKFVFDAKRNRLRLPEHAWADWLELSYTRFGALWKDDAFRDGYFPELSVGQLTARVAAARRFYGDDFTAYHLAPMPIPERDRVEFEAHKGELRRHFALGNFGVVANDLVLEGRAMFNTIVLIFLAIATHITVNPLAAYALSRFRLRYTYKVLLFMLATMAFPPAVAMIPSFLLLKHFGLINSYAALVLPGIASGYTIFLLKGFFDALPQELYEAAEIDGAGKITTFLNVTFPLSKPIFAIITLNSFTAAYSGFMWAFLICPDSKMWTIMVHLFNIQQTNTAPIAMAALVIAAIPTFLVFLFCQNVILRGIIVPSFK